MIMRDMDRALTTTPTMADMGNMHHWVDRSVWTETVDPSDAQDRPEHTRVILRRGRDQDGHSRTTAKSQICSPDAQSGQGLTRWGDLRLHDERSRISRY